MRHRLMLPKFRCARFKIHSSKEENEEADDERDCWPWDCWPTHSIAGTLFRYNVQSSSSESSVLTVSAVIIILRWNHCSHAFPTIHETVEEPGDLVWSSDLRVRQGNVSLQECISSVQLLTCCAMHTCIFIYNEFWTFIQISVSRYSCCMRIFSDIHRVLKFNLC